MTHTDHIAWSRRPIFRPRQVLTAEQLNEGLKDEFDRQRLLNRGVHGYGVVLGFGPVVNDEGALKLDHGCFELTAGLAFDRHGRMLYWPGGHVSMRDIVGERPHEAGQYTLVAHYARRPPQIGGCPPFVADRSPWLLDGVVFTLVAGCRDTDRSCPAHPTGSCVGHNEYLCRRTGGWPGDDDGTVPVSEDVAWLTVRPGEMIPACVEDWTYDPDTHVAVPLACLKVDDVVDRDREGPDCDPRYDFVPAPPHPCDVRPFVYRNPLLYELARDCDVALPRVRSISWQHWIDRGWQAKVKWADFEQMIKNDGLVVYFTRQIRTATLHEASVFLDAILPERDADYFRTRRIPTDGLEDATRLEVLDEHGAALDRNTAELCWGVRLKPTQDWLQNEITGKYSNLFGGGRFEFTVRGQLLRDHCGRMLDARPVGTHGRGQARPGDDYMSAFQVDKRKGPYPNEPANEE